VSELPLSLDSRLTIGSHGYLLAQFLSPQTNRRTDDFGGSPAKRAEIVLQIIRRIRKETSKGFCIGIKLNSVDAASTESLSDVIEQIQLIVNSGIDFIEISGGTYENPRMMQEPSAVGTQGVKKSSIERESFFLQFAQTVRENFPSITLMVTGGFRTRQGMEAALKSGACDLIGIARPAAVLPALPKEIILNTKEVMDEDATVTLAPLRVPFIINALPIKPLGGGFQSTYYASQIQRMAKGLKPVDTRIRITKEQ
jgi:2,4-dienoyl-CoA reductase-like NADH-dependent reductase (Old Yellow Enzyme family)